MTLAELAHSRAVLQDYIVRGVTEARRGGSTWAGIASSLGVTASEAHRRYSWLDKIAQPPADSDPDITKNSPA